MIFFTIKVDNDGNYHHLFYDLTIKFPDQSRTVVIFELLATASHSTLNKHFQQIIDNDLLIIGKITIY
jgi:hypothetical protein